MCIAADTSILINFLCISRMDLLGDHPSSFITTSHVAKEIINPDQRIRYAAALSENHIAEISGFNRGEDKIFSDALQESKLGSGESSVIAVALGRKYRLAIDDEKAAKHALYVGSMLKRKVCIVRTQDIVLDLIRCKTLSIEEADSIRADWECNHRFRLPISSFGDLL